MQEAAHAFQPFDLQRMFLGDKTSVLVFLEIAFRTIVMYAYTLMFARFVGKRAIGQISPFEFILVIAIGSAAGDPMFYLNVPLLHGMTVMSVVILLHRLMGYATARSERMENLVEGNALLLVKDGEVVEGAVTAYTISRRELFMSLREKGVQDVGEVEKAYLEPSGRLSVFHASPDRRKKTQSTEPRELQSVGS
jgi:uncharacterized membrane protein YcaP (DUF421 family)